MASLTPLSHASTFQLCIRRYLNPSRGAPLRGTTHLSRHHACLGVHFGRAPSRSVRVRRRCGAEGAPPTHLLLAEHANEVGLELGEHLLVVHVLEGGGAV